MGAPSCILFGVCDDICAALVVAGDFGVQVMEEYMVVGACGWACIALMTRCKNL